MVAAIERAAVAPGFGKPQEKPMLTVDISRWQGGIAIVVGYAAPVEARGSLEGMTMNDLTALRRSSFTDSARGSTGSATALTVNRLYVAEPEFDEFRTAMTAVARAALASAACLLFEVAANRDDGAVLVVERWCSERDQQAFVQQESFADLIATWRPRIESEMLVCGRIEE